MKEPDDNILPPRSAKRSTAGPSNAAVKMARQGPLIRPPVKQPSVPQTYGPQNAPATVEEFGKTLNCPSCQSGMEAPGIRHSAECKRRRAEFELRKKRALEERDGDGRSHVGTPISVDPPLPPPSNAVDNRQLPVPLNVGGDDVVVSGAATSTLDGGRHTKRAAETDVVEMQKAIKQGESMELDQLELDLAWMDTGNSLLSPLGCSGHNVGDSATRPEFFDESVSSSKFFADKDLTRPFICKDEVGRQRSVGLETRWCCR